MADASEERLQFAWKNFEDQQAIIRAADLKAGYLVTFLLFFGASTIPLGREVFPKLRWEGSGAMASVAYGASYVLSMIGFVWSMYLISHVMTPRAKKQHTAPKPGANLLFFGHVTKFENSDQYFEAVAKAEPEQLLRNITDQIFELAQIAKAKLDSLKAFSKSFQLTLVAWFISTAVGFWIMNWK